MSDSERGGIPGAEGWEDALEKLPHGEGFRFVDRILDLDPSVSGSGEWTVRGDEDFLRGHFPGNPIVPGVIMIEAMAQLAGVVFCADSESPGHLLLTAVRSVKISGTASPGAILEINVRITGTLGAMVQAAGTVSVEGRELMRGDVVLASG